MTHCLRSSKSFPIQFWQTKYLQNQSYPLTSQQIRHSFHWGLMLISAQSQLFVKLVICNPGLLLPSLAASIWLGNMLRTLLTTIALSICYMYLPVYFKSSYHWLRITQSFIINQANLRSLWRFNWVLPYIGWADMAMGPLLSETTLGEDTKDPTTHWDSERIGRED